MIRISLLCFCLLSLIFEVRSQSPLEEDGNQFNLSSGYTTTGIPVFLSYEMGIHPDISFGLEASYRRYTEDVDSLTYDHNIAGFTFFGNYYFNSLLNMDEKKMGLYGGLNLSYFKWFSPEGYFNKGNSSSTLAIGAQIGYRYYFGSMAVFLEGTGNTDFAGGKLGITYRIR